MKKAFLGRKWTMRLRSVYPTGKVKNLLTGPENCAIIIYSFAAGDPMGRCIRTLNKAICYCGSVGRAADS